MLDFWKGKRVLITGHTGFKGSWLALWLKHLGSEICGYALAPEPEPNLFRSLRLEEQIKSVTGDVRDLLSFEKAVNDFQPEIIFHLAAQSLVRKSYRAPVETYTTNVIGTIHLLETVRQAGSVRAVVVATTDKVYENNGAVFPYSENDRLGGFDPYSTSKACAELATASYRDSFFAESPTLIATARAGNVIGGGDWSEDRLLPDVFRSLIFGERLLIRSPDSVRPWQHTLEPLGGYLLLAENLFQGKKTSASAFNFGSSPEDAQTVRWVLEEIRRNWNAPVDWDIVRDTQPHEATILKLDSSKAEKKLNWSPKLHLTEAIRLTIEWYRDFKDGRDLIGTTRRQIDSYQNKL